MAHEPDHSPERPPPLPPTPETGRFESAPPTVAALPPAALRPLAPPAGNNRGLWGGLAVGGVLLLKLKSLLLAGLGAFKLLKFGTTAITMLLAIVVYAQLYGWPFAVGFVLLILIHEMGHYLVFRSLGIPVSAPVFIPFFGAFVTAPRAENVLVESYSALAGPVAGTLGAFGCLVIFWLTGAPFWLALAYVGFFLNFFNLLPITPLDGGRVAASISRHLWWAGGAGLLALLFFRPSPILVLMLFLAALQLWNEYQHPAELRASYYAISPQTRLQMGLLYFGLALLLGFACVTTFQQLEALHH